MEIEKNKNNGSVIAIIILVILLIVLGGYIGYDKFLSKDTTSTTEKVLDSKTNAKNEVETDKENEVETTEEKSDYVKTRICTGIYSGTAALTENIQTGQYGKGILSIELKTDGTYELKKENVNGASGTYTIIDNTLLLKTAPDTCGPDMDCSAKYSDYLNISDDCSSISLGYGPHFFDPNFTLNK